MFHRSTAKWLLLCLSVVLPGLMPGAVQAATLSFYCISTGGTTAVDCPIATAQITVDVTGVSPGVVNFRFNNTGPLVSSISEVYFDNGTLLGISSVAHSAGDPWTGGSASPGNLPGGASISPPFVTTAGFLAESNPSPSQNGVRPGEYLDVVFNLQGGGTLADVLAELVTGEIRLGMHVIAFASGGSVSIVNAPVVPVPAAAWLFGSSFGLLLIARRKAASW